MANSLSVVCYFPCIICQVWDLYHFGYWEWLGPQYTQSAKTYGWQYSFTLCGTAVYSWEAG